LLAGFAVAAKSRFWITGTKCFYRTLSVNRNWVRRCIAPMHLCQAEDLRSAGRTESEIYNPTSGKRTTCWETSRNCWRAR